MSDEAPGDAGAGQLRIQACGDRKELPRQGSQGLRQLVPQADAPLAVLPTRTHGSIIDPERAAPDSKESIAETTEERALLGKLILRALGCKDFDDYRAIQAEWETISAQTADLRKAPDQQYPDYFHQYMQGNFFVTDDQGSHVQDYMLEFFSSTDRKYEVANVYLHGRVIEGVEKNSQNPALRNILFDRTDLVEGYYPRLQGIDPVIYLSVSAAAPGGNISYFRSEETGAEGQVPVHLEGDHARRWLKRNSTHFVHIIIPRIPAADVFKLTNFSSV